METEAVDSGWKGLYKVGGAAALTAVGVGVIEVMITFLPGGGTSEGVVTVVDWFTLFQDNWFMGLRNLGLLNIVITILGIPVFLALYGAHRRGDGVYAALAMITAFIGTAVFLATNRAFPMLDLSHRYAAAATDVERAVLEAAGQVMLSVGKSHTPGTFLGFFLSEVAGIIISIVMLRGNVFGKVGAYAGMLGFGLLLVSEVCSSFVPTLSGVAMIFAMGGGLLGMTWYVLAGRRLLQLGEGTPGEGA